MDKTETGSDARAAERFDGYTVGVAIRGPGGEVIGVGEQIISKREVEQAKFPHQIIRYHAEQATLRAMGDRFKTKAQGGTT